VPIKLRAATSFLWRRLQRVRSQHAARCCKLRRISVSERALRQLGQRLRHVRVLPGVGQSCSTTRLQVWCATAEHIRQVFLGQSCGQTTATYPMKCVAENVEGCDFGTLLYLPGFCFLAGRLVRSTTSAPMSFATRRSLPPERGRSARQAPSATGQRTCAWLHRRRVKRTRLPARAATSLRVGAFRTAEARSAASRQRQRRPRSCWLNVAYYAQPRRRHQPLHLRWPIGIAEFRRAALPGGGLACTGQGRQNRRNHRQARLKSHQQSLPEPGRRNNLRTVLPDTALRRCHCSHFLASGLRTRRCEAAHAPRSGYSVESRLRSGSASVVLKVAPPAPPLRSRCCPQHRRSAVGESWRRDHGQGSRRGDDADQRGGKLKQRRHRLAVCEACRAVDAAWPEFGHAELMTASIRTGDASFRTHQVSFLPQPALKRRRCAVGPRLGSALVIWSAALAACQRVI
jgi:hypothetical protein